MLKLSTADKQAIWDALLLAQWHKDGMMGVLVAMYTRAVGIQDGEKNIIEALSEIKRAPRVKTHLHKPVRVFVDSAMKRLSDMLWDGVPDVQILKFLDESPIDTKTGQGRKRPTAVRRIVSPHKGHRRSDWNICKPTSAR